MIRVTISVNREFVAEETFDYDKPGWTGVRVFNGAEIMAQVGRDYLTPADYIQIRIKETE